MPEARSVKTHAKCCFVHVFSLYNVIQIYYVIASIVSLAMINKGFSDIPGWFTTVVRGRDPFELWNYLEFPITSK